MSSCASCAVVTSWAFTISWNFENIVWDINHWIFILISLQSGYCYVFYCQGTVSSKILLKRQYLWTTCSVARRGMLSSSPWARLMGLISFWCQYQGMIMWCDMWYKDWFDKKLKDERLKSHLIKDYSFIKKCSWDLHSSKVMASYYSYFLSYVSRDITTVFRLHVSTFNWMYSAALVAH